MITAGLVLLFFGLAVLFEHLYYQPANHDLTTKSFQQELNKKWETAATHLDQIKKDLAEDKIPSLTTSSDVFYYVYLKDHLIYWTENTLGVPIRYSDLQQDYPLLQLQNAYCVSLQDTYKNYRILALIKIKNNYASVNDYLANDFSEGFDFNSQVSICSGSSTDYGAVFSPSSDYLFTLIGSASPNKIFYALSICCWILGFLLLFYGIYRLYYFLGEKKLSFRYFGLSAILSGFVVGCCLWFEIPQILFSTEFFSPVYYASGGWFSSLGHLMVISLWVLTEVLMLVFALKRYRIDIASNSKVVFIASFQLFCLCGFLLVCLLFQNLIYNSSIRIIVSSIDGFTPQSVLFLLLILCWFCCFVLLRVYGLRILGKQYSVKQSFLYNGIVSLVALVACWLLNFNLLILIWYFIFCVSIDFLYSRKSQFFAFSHLSVLILLVSLFVVWFSAKHSDAKNADKYRTLAENIQLSEVLERNAFTEILFEDLNQSFYADQTFWEMAREKNPSLVAIQNYLHQNYFRGFWDNYDIKLFLYNPAEETQTDLEKVVFYSKLRNRSERIKDSRFYFCGDKKSKIDYLGVLPLGNRTLYIEFHSKLLMPSYSYPEPLLESDNQSAISKWISVARYENNAILSQTGRFSYPSNINWIPSTGLKNFSFNYGKYTHHIYMNDEGNATVVSLRERNIMFLFSYWVYLFVLYLVVLYAAYGIYFYHNRKKINYSFRFYTKLQLSYLSLLIISFVAIFYVSANYVIDQYKEHQNKELQDKMKYIKQFIQETFKEDNRLRDQNIIDLGFYLQDLSRSYRTDIHIYDPQGYLLTSSQPLIFSKGLMSSYIASVPYFNKKDNYIQTEQIGKLNYLSAYTHIYNDKGKLLGYIAVPSFLSADEMHREIFWLLSKFINICLVIILLALFFSWLINRQLSKPLEALEGKLKGISLKGKNEKLYYPQKDEIGHLVEQYNRMVDQLEESAEILARSERETAWKQMARQVTHEINNPLTPMKLTIQQLQRMQASGNDGFNEYFEKSSKMLIEQIEHLSRIATSFSNFAKMPEAHLERINLQERLATVVNLFKHNNEEVSIKYNYPDDEMIVLADKEQLGQVFNNLLKNAIQSIPSDRKGVVEITLKKQIKTVIVEIKDNGAGVADELKDKIFNPNFTTKTSGTGLGLAIVSNIVTGIGGRVWFDTKAGIGSTFFVELPFEFSKLEK